MSSVPPPQPRRNNAVWWILGILVGGTVLLVVFGLMFAGLFIRLVTVNESGKKVEIETPVGTLRVKNDDSHPTDLPVYPGATPVKSEGTSVEFTSQNGSGGGVATENYTTPDDLDKVVAWYAQHLGPKFRRENRAEVFPHARGTHVSDADVAYVNDTGEGSRVVALKKKYPAVEITLVRAGKKQIQ